MKVLDGTSVRCIEQRVHDGTWDRRLALRVSTEDASDTAEVLKVNLVVLAIRVGVVPTKLLDRPFRAPKTLVLGKRVDKLRHGGIELG